jgi:hypothetical protein
MDNGVFLFMLALCFVFLGASLVALFYALFTLSKNCNAVLRSHRTVRDMFAGIKAEVSSSEKRVCGRLGEIDGLVQDVMKMLSIATKMGIVKEGTGGEKPDPEGEN